MYTMAWCLLRNVGNGGNLQCVRRLHDDGCRPGGQERVHIRSEPRVTETVAEIVTAHREGLMSPAQSVARSFQRIRDHNDPAVFISLRDEADALKEAEALRAIDAARLPLFGVPVAVKDNIDVQGLPTTAACPAFAYMPARDATAVAKLRAAGAV